MKLWLSVVCVLGFLSGGVFTMYSSISIGSQGLNSMAASLKSIAPVMNSLYKNFNNARNKVMPTIDNLVNYVNTTYKTMNDSYGVSQSQNMGNVMMNLEWFGKQFFYGEQQVTYHLGYDLSAQNNELKDTMDQMLQYYNQLIMAYAYQQNGETCTSQLAAAAAAIPDQLAKFGTCLQTEVDTVPTLVAPLQDIFKLTKSDFISLNKQLKICASTSTNCINEYFNSMTSELSNINQILYMAYSLLYSYQYTFRESNQLCGNLIKQNVQDKANDLMVQSSQCMYPM
nr:uncharacterized protein LOC109399260 [Aedes albopictus]